MLRRKLLALLFPQVLVKQPSGIACPVCHYANHTTLGYHVTSSNGKAFNPLTDNNFQDVRCLRCGNLFATAI